jgi:hypothetical protein
VLKLGHPVKSSAALRLLPLLLLCTQCEKQASSDTGKPSAAQPSERPTKVREARDEDEPDPRELLKQSFQAAGSEPDAAAREKAYEVIAWEGIDLDPDLAREAFAQLEPGGEAARRLVAHFAMRLADQDPAAALEWAAGLEQAEEKEDALARIAVVISDKDPLKAAGMLDALTEGRQRDLAAVQVAQRWVRQAPAAAAEWVAGLSSDAARTDGLREVATAWLASDAAGYAVWAMGREEESMIAASASAAAAALRNLPDESTRRARLAAMADESFRARVEAELAGK